MSSLVATNWPKPIPLIPCLSWSTASLVFTQGVMSASINWALLENQYFANELYQNDLAKMVRIVGEEVSKILFCKLITSTYEINKCEIVIFTYLIVGCVPSWSTFCSALSSKYE